MRSGGISGCLFWQAYAGERGVAADLEDEILRRCAAQDDAVLKGAVALGDAVVKTVVTLGDAVVALAAPFPTPKVTAGPCAARSLPPSDLSGVVNAKERV